MSLTAERTPKKKCAVQTPEKQRPKGGSSDGASAPSPPPPRPGLLGGFPMQAQLPGASRAQLRSQPLRARPLTRPMKPWRMWASSSCPQARPPARALMGPRTPALPPREAGLLPPTPVSLPPSPAQHPGESQAHVTAAGRPRVIADSCAWHTLPGPPLPTVSPHKEEGQPPSRGLGEA